MFAMILTAAMFAPAVVAERETAPPPRAKCSTTGTESCMCPDGLLRCRARSALALTKLPPTPAPAVASRKPTAAELEAAKKALEKKK